jgi:hypothetical protein
MVGYGLPVSQMLFNNNFRRCGIGQVTVTRRKTGREHVTSVPDAEQGTADGSTEKPGDVLQGHIKAEVVKHST